jgi:hypothetical protein
MRQRSSTVCAVTVVALALSVPAWAQPAPEAHEWGHGTTLTGFTGAAVDSLRSGPLFGGAIGWEIMPKLAIEGSGLWVEHGSGTDAFAGALKVQAALLRRHAARPFLQAGVGLYRASFDVRDEMPDFYSDRIRSEISGHGLIRTFMDPTLVAGGGVDLLVSRNLAVRPDIETMFVLHDGKSHVVTAIRINVVYHFEEHPVTPARSGR